MNHTITPPVIPIMPHPRILISTCTRIGIHRSKAQELKLKQRIVRDPGNYLDLPKFPRCVLLWLALFSQSLEERLAIGKTSSPGVL
jgi:hypothetical protein